MAGVQPQTLRQDELPEYSFVGPFGGIQSEVPTNQIRRSGFAEAQNVIFRKAGAYAAPLFQALASPRSGTAIYQLLGTIAGLTGFISGLSQLAAGEVIMGIADFFNVVGQRLFVVWTPTKMFQWTGGQWIQITGSLTGSQAQYFSWDVVGYKLYFSQQKDVVQVWDGQSNSFAAAAVGAVPAKYVCEIDFHLLAANTFEGGQFAPNRVHWTGIGDGTDWSSFSSGQTDLFNAFGPINGLCRLDQMGYAFQQWGLTRIIPTGIGLKPFDFITIGSRAKGSITPYGLASFGNTIAAYIGKNDVYMFDGNESSGIGSRPIDGNRRLGARTRIFNDINSSNLNNIFGFINTSDNGVDYESYWILIPSLNKAWVYHFDEGNWAQIYFSAGRLNGPVGIFQANNSGAPEIIQLSGKISDQSWSFASFTNPAPLDTMAIADANASSIALMQPHSAGSYPTSGSIKTSDGWYLRSGQLDFEDPRHNHTVKKVRIVTVDLANVTINIRFTNEKKQTWLRTLTYGNGSGEPVINVVDVNLNGRFITWELSGPPGINFELSDISPIYDVSGEIQGGTR